MRAQVTTRWSLLAEGPPVLEQPCPRCDRRQSFVCTGRFRVNAHRRRLDVWLLFECARCSWSWRLPVEERVAVDAIPPPRLAAYHHNDEALAYQIATDEGAVRPLRVVGAVLETPFLLTFDVAPGVVVRLDRALAQGLSWSRARVREAWERGSLAVVPSDPKALRRVVRDGLTVWCGAQES